MANAASDTVQKMHNLGEPILLKGNDGIRKQVQRKCPSCNQIAPVVKDKRHWQRPAIMAAGLFTGFLGLLAMPIRDYTVRCGRCGYKYR